MCKCTCRQDVMQDEPEAAECTTEKSDYEAKPEVIGHGIHT
jgi:hypothetical protein